MNAIETHFITLHELAREVDSVALGPFATRCAQLLASVSTPEEGTRTHLNELPRRRQVRARLLPPELAFNPHSVPFVREMGPTHPCVVERSHSMLSRGTT